MLQVLKGQEMNTQVLHSHIESIVKLETQTGQLATAFNRRDEGKYLFSPSGQYMAENSNGPENYIEHA